LQGLLSKPPAPSTAQIHPDADKYARKTTDEFHA
jgi:hypothetical protein